MLKPPGSSSRGGSSTRYASNRRKTIESPADQMRKLSKLQPNKKCADCQTKLPQCVNLTVGSFICMTCAGIHREINLKIKSLGHSTFTDQEVEVMKQSDNDKVNEVWLALYDPQKERSRLNRQPEGNQNQEHCRTWIKRKYQDKRWFSSDRGGGGATGTFSSPRRNKQLKPTVAQIPPVADLFGGFDVPSSQPTITSNNDDTNWAAFDRSNEQQQQQMKSDPFAQNVVANKLQQQQQQIPAAQEGGFANFNQVPNQTISQQLNLQQHQVPIAQQPRVATFSQAGNQTALQQQQQQAGFANFNQTPNQTLPQQLKQQQQQLPVAQQVGFTNFNRVDSQIAPQQQQQQQQQQLMPISQEGGFANFNQALNQTVTQQITVNNNQGQLQPLGAQGKQQDLKFQDPFGNMAPLSNQVASQQPNNNLGQLQAQGQQQHVVQLQDPFGNMSPPPQEQIGVQQQILQHPTLVSTNGQQTQQSNDVVSNKLSQENFGGQPQEAHTQVQILPTTKVEKEELIDVFAHLSVDSNSGAMKGSVMGSNQPAKDAIKDATDNTVIQYKEKDFVCYKSHGNRERAQVVKKHLDGELQPFYTISIMGREKQTDSNHLEPLDPSFRKIESILLSMSPMQLKQVETFLGSIDGNKSPMHSLPLDPSLGIPNIVEERQSSAVSNLTQQPPCQFQLSSKAGQQVLPNNAAPSSMAMMNRVSPSAQQPQIQPLQIQQQQSQTTQGQMIGQTSAMTHQQQQPPQMAQYYQQPQHRMRVQMQQQQQQQPPQIQQFHQQPQEMQGKINVQQQQQQTGSNPSPQGNPFDVY